MQNLGQASSNSTVAQAGSGRSMQILAKQNRAREATGQYRANRFLARAAEKKVHAAASRSRQNSGWQNGLSGSRTKFQVAGKHSQEAVCKSRAPTEEFGQLEQLIENLSIKPYFSIFCGICLVVKLLVKLC